MKNKPIRTLDDLQREISQLKALTKQQEQSIRNDVQRIREELRPENLAVSILSSWTGIPLNRNEFLKNGFLVGVGLLLQRFVFKTESTLERKVYSWIDKVFDRLKSMVNKFTTTGKPRTDSVVDQTDK